MRLTGELEQLATAEQSPFRAQLLREDVVRLRKLEEITRSVPELDACRRAARRLGWTALDARAHELAEPLDQLVGAIRESQRGAADATDDRIRAAWIELTRIRTEQMVGCLSTRLPKPLEG
jgi:hypothetical protein